MCTVTYLPSRGGYTLTHNRDEAPSRSLLTIDRIRTKNGDTLLLPRDAKAGGTWIVAAQGGKTACLLNGAFVKHRHEPPYRRSRGLMLLDFFDIAEPRDFFEGYELEGIEPFTFLFFQHGEAVEFRWDGVQRFYKILPGDKAHFWCSATLYPGEMQSRREQVFRDWLASQPGNNPPAPRKIIDLHLTGSVGDPAFDFVMEREGRVQTVSITQIVARKKVTRMRYLDLLEGNKDERFVSMKDR